MKPKKTPQKNSHVNTSVFRNTPNSTIKLNSGRHLLRLSSLAASAVSLIFQTSFPHLSFSSAILFMLVLLRSFHKVWVFFVFVLFRRFLFFVLWQKWKYTICFSFKLQEVVILDVKHHNGCLCLCKIL